MQLGPRQHVQGAEQRVVRIDHREATHSAASHAAPHRRVPIPGTAGTPPFPTAFQLGGRRDHGVRAAVICNGSPTRGPPSKAGVFLGNYGLIKVVARIADCV